MADLSQGQARKDWNSNPKGNRQGMLRRFKLEHMRQERLNSCAARRAESCGRLLLLAVSQAMGHETGKERERKRKNERERAREIKR
eukprot:10461889-Alexandrium_andersonii.AAC.1